MVEGKIYQVSCYQEIVSEKNGKMVLLIRIRSESLLGPELRHFWDSSEEAQWADNGILQCVCQGIHKNPDFLISN